MGVLVKVFPAPTFVECPNAFPIWSGRFEQIQATFKKLKMALNREHSFLKLLELRS